MHRVCIEKHLPLKFSGETTNEACLPVWMRSAGMPTTTLPDLGADLSYESGQERDVTSPARVEHPRGEARARTQKKKSCGVLLLIKEVLFLRF
ncbi:hypothetical protein TNCT_426421 [Trichonephila clavata]|uniref:Uncharacterized protein n=1 Tax=Trichonephila clavata TaxID=2740835 RepID=A0A8X6KS84_TRICU|nr:hypothetical protein TNCT_426421 [Trichonephila clavata]